MVVEYNLFHRLDHYPLDRDMMEDGVEPIPIELWDWGILNRTGHLRERSSDIVKLALLPRAKATVTLRGIQCNGLFYSCERAIKEQWFVKARQASWSFEASYDPRKSDIIYLNLGNGELEPCHLLPREERFKDLRIEEVLEFQEIQKQKSALHKSRRIQSSAEFNAFTKATIDNATELTEAVQKRTTSDCKRTQAIRSNRQEEKERLRDKQAWDLRQGGQEMVEGMPSAVVAFPSAEYPDDSESLTVSRRKKFLEAIERSEQGGDE